MSETPNSYVHPPPLCHVEVDAQQGTIHARVIGEIDLSTVAMVERRIDAALDESAATRLVVDLRELAFMDSTGLRLLVSLRRNAEPRGYELVLVRPPADVYRAVEISGLDATLHFVDDPSEATGG